MKYHDAITALLIIAVMSILGILAIIEPIKEPQLISNWPR